MAKLYLIDGMSLVFRAYHAMFQSNLKNSQGVPTGAIFGFTNIITSLIEKEKPDYMAVAFDRAEPTFRHEKYALYKANRDAFPEDLIPQLPKIKQLLDLLSIPRIERAGFEADDIIGAMAKRAGKENWEVYCVTSDKDFYQLVDDKISLYKPGKRGEDFELVSYAGVKEKFGVNPDQVIDVLAIIGDSSDNVPGVKGIGDKTAIPLVQLYGSLEAIYDNIDKIDKASVKTKLIEHKEIAFLSKELVTIETNIDVELTTENCKLEKANYIELDTFFGEQGFHSIRNRWRNKGIIQGIDYLNSDKIPSKIDEASVASPPIIEEKFLTIKDLELDYQFIDTMDKLKDLAKQLSNEKVFSFDIETSSLNRNDCEVVGISFSFKDNQAFYIPTEQIGRSNSDEQTSLFGSTQVSENQKRWACSLDLLEVLTVLKPILENENIGKCGQNAKFDMYILSRFGVIVTPLVFDSMIASYLIDPDQKHGMDALSQRLLNYIPVPISSLIGEKKSTQLSMKDIDPIDIKDYACEDADITLKLKNHLDKELIQNNLTKLAYEIEFPLVEVLRQIERNGVCIDQKSLADASKQIQIDVYELQGKIFEEAGIQFNIDSPKQMAHVLFEKLMLPSGKKTKTGFSTDVEVLNDLAENYKIAEYILDYRQLMKLKSTYIDALPRLVNIETGRIHTTFNQTIAATGRLSSTDPNLQNIPIRSDKGKEIRRAFVPQNDDYVILSADYSQIELRIMAYYCNDTKMIDSFKQGLDIHTATASILYNEPLEKVNSDMRRVAKTVNFGIMYGLGSFGLSQRLKISRAESKQIIENYFDKYPGIKKYMELTIEETREFGYAKTLCGRRRFFHDILSKNKNLRTAAERGAINLPIQGTASDMMKIAMISIHNEMQKMNLKSKMIIQVHDELVFETHKSEITLLSDLVKNRMEKALPLGDVPVVVETGIGPNWLVAH